MQGKNKLVICLGMSLVLRTWDIPRKSQAFPKADGRHTILFKVRGTGLAVYFPCLPARCGTDYPCSPARCGQAWVFLPARCGKAWLFLYLTFIMEDRHCPDNLKKNAPAQCTLT